MNQIKTAALLALMTSIFGFAGMMLGGQQGMIMALGLALAGNLFAFFASDKMVLRMYGAQPLESGPIYDMVQDLANRAGLPMPKVYWIDSDQPNAFATGRSPSHAAVAVNRGLVEMLTEDELRGVIGHELAHVQRRDTLIMTVTATLAGALSTLANFGFLFGGARDEEGRRMNPLIAMAVMILAPIAAMLVQMAISRTREYGADRRGAEICGDPMALARALEKIHQGAKRIPNITAEHNPATAHLFIMNPLHGQGMDNLFSTHPNTENRIRALMELSGNMTPFSAVSSNYSQHQQTANLYSAQRSDQDASPPFSHRRRGTFRM